MADKTFAERPPAEMKERGVSTKRKKSRSFHPANKVCGIDFAEVM